MAERNAVKPRKCNKCERTLELTAGQLKSHAKTCKGAPDA